MPRLIPCYGDSIFYDDKEGVVVYTVNDGTTVFFDFREVFGPIARMGTKASGLIWDHETNTWRKR